ncbi:MAG: hypothetical protein Fur0043_24080 [Anaerolineales bacterium]
MNRKKTSLRPAPINLPRRLREGLDEADALLEKNKAEEALEILEELDERYPNQVYVLEMLIDAYAQLQDSLSLLSASHRLHRLTPNRAGVKLSLASAYLKNIFLALALATFREFLKRWPQHEEANKVRKAVQRLETELPKMLAKSGLNFETEFDLACQHEEVQVCTTIGEFSRAKSLIKKIQRQRPDFVAPQNNLSQIYEAEGDLPRAIKTARGVLALQPDNLHAQANLIRYLYLSGQREAAAPLIERLKAFTGPAAQRWTKIAETLAFIGDDEGMLKLAACAKEEAEPTELDASFYHFLAVSECLLGQEKEARKHWQRTLKINANFTPARENLEDLKKPVYERNGPWAFPLAQVLPKNTIRQMARLVEQEARRKGEENFQPAVRRFLDEHPELLQMAPLLLERGDAMAKEYVVVMADMSGHPALLSLLKEYALGQKGSDEFRMKMAQTLSKFNVLPAGEVTMWLRGKWHPILLLGFEVTPEPMMDDYPMKQKAIDLMGQAMDALRAEDGARAEGFLRKALTIQPEHPSLLNNLALALEMQGKRDEYETILQHIINDFPNYFFGQIALARKSIHTGDLDKARAILNHWMETKKKYHVTEFNILCKTQIDLFIAEDNIEGALSWMKMWKETALDAPAFEAYQRRLEM